jgi:hypothetical protein
LSSMPVSLQNERQEATPWPTSQRASRSRPTCQRR